MGKVSMISSYKIYETLHNNDFNEKQAKALTECLEDLNKNTKEYSNDYAVLKSDLRELKNSSDVKFEGIQRQIEFLDQKIDILRSDVNKSIGNLTYWMMASFALVFACFGYLMFK